MAISRFQSASTILARVVNPAVTRAFSAAATAVQDGVESASPSRSAISYILATRGCVPGTEIHNFPNKLSSSQDAGPRTALSEAQAAIYDISSQVGSCMPINMMRIGTMIHNIEMRPGQGAKLVRSAGTCAKIMKEPTSRYVPIRLPSGVEKLIDTNCRATIGQVSNPGHGGKKLRKAGQNRWRGWRPTVRGVAMNPCDHPHGGGEGKSKSSGSHGRTSQTPWGKPCKGGYKTGPLKRRK